VRILINKKSRPHWAVLQYIVIFMVISASATVWIQEGVDLMNSTVLTWGFVLLSMLWIVFHLRIRLSSSHIITIIFMVVCVLMYTLLHANYLWLAYVRVFVPALVFSIMGCMLRQVGQLQNMYGKFVNVICVFAGVSLVFYFFVNVIPVLSPTRYYSYEWTWGYSVPSYFGLYFNPMKIGFGGVAFARNCGVFPEAPMFVYPLSFALTIHDLLLPEHMQHKYKRLLLIVTLITTFSTTAYMMLILLYGYKFVTNKNKRVKSAKFVMIPIALLIVAYLLTVIIEEKIGTSSYGIRMDHVLASLKCFAATHLLGCGIGNAEYVERFMIYRQGIACGIPYMFAQGGLMWAAFYLIPLIRTAIKGWSRNKNVTWFMVLFFVLLFMTACQARPITWFIFGMIVVPMYVPKEMKEHIY